MEARDPEKLPGGTAAAAGSAPSLVRKCGYRQVAGAPGIPGNPSILSHMKRKPEITDREELVIRSP
jgi:hypothetical protein